MTIKKLFRLIMARDKFGLELRKRILCDYSDGISQKDISEKYEIHKSSVSRIISKFKKSGDISVTHRGGQPR